MGALVIAIPLVIYIIGALSVARRDVAHPDDFFVAYRKVGVTAFASSSIAYGFQVSTIYPFLLWGASGFFFVPAVNAVFWGLGILFFYLCFPLYKRFIGTAGTLHGLLGSQFGMRVRTIASYLTIVGFVGFAIAETYFGSKVLQSVIGDKPTLYLLLAASMLFVFGYIAYGGQLSSIRTDQLQLVISYIGVFGLLLYFLYLLESLNKSSTGVLSLGFAVLAVYIPIILLLRRFRFIRFSEEPSRSNRLINVLLNAMIGILLIAILATSLFEIACNGVHFDGASLLNTTGFGSLGLASLIILPLFWQFVDLTNWQRLLAVKPTDANEPDGAHRNIRKGLLLYAVESPFTWVIFLFFGLLAATSLPNFQFQDLLIDLPRRLLGSGDPVEEFFGYTFIISVLSIMLSTVDSFIVGVIFTYVYDSNAWTRGLLDRGDELRAKKHYSGIMNRGRFFGFLVILVGMASFVFFDTHVKNGGELFINLLLTFYSAQLSFTPLVLGILFLRKRPSPGWAAASMVLGALSGIAVGLYSVIWDPRLAWYPIPTCVGLSTIVYLWGMVTTNSDAKRQHGGVT